MVICGSISKACIESFILLQVRQVDTTSAEEVITKFASTHAKRLQIRLQIFFVS